MTTTPLHHPPRLSQVVREQLRVTALSIRLPAIALGAIAAVVAMLVIANFLRGRGGVEFAPELSLIPAFAGALMPIAVWLNEQRFGAGFMWTLPVDRTRHALAKVFAGWIILIVAVTGFVIWLLILALITKGNITGDEIIRLLPASYESQVSSVDPSMLRTVRWVFHPVLWFVPFTAATGTYALGSALALGFRHPFRWIIGAIAAVYLTAAVGQGIADDQFWDLSAKVTRTLFEGRYGIDALLSARVESLKTLVRLSNGQTVSAWKGLPVVSDWIVATLLWTGLGVAGLSAALRRHRENR
jgi:hypothetical protein